ncbi:MULTISPECIES: GNAT family N-acetyltransferase [unclassified Isoptericola]|uniref:GNAT family N-acetyltransferase n=1 Tax=unclassified Isoptericola TaxID=2623355 RepID=UPI00271333E4|nr:MULTISPECIES: GNAT family N-acetyltransferase [unclassified Isoptericola]MDO8144804.1 GNAT family N-acetyltransferase [Isoptericola sp. 178]MDO8149584.1 GNAT family N-acetyltransferase [Isoptericola sp. b515]
MTLRPRRDADLPELVERLDETHRLDRYPVRPASVRVGWLTAHDGPAFVALVAGRPVGHVAVHGHGPCEIVRFFVAPTARGRGLAGALLDRAVTAARLRCDDVVLQVMEHSTAAIAFYERRGWRRTGASTMDWDDAGRSCHWYTAP